MTRRPRKRRPTEGALPSDTRRSQAPEVGPDKVVWDDFEPRLIAENDLRPFNPLDTKNLAIAVAKAALEKDAWPLDGLPTFRGAGIYVIYYTGEFSAYERVAKENIDARRPRWPIYIGKAQPPGGRRGNFNLEATDTVALYGRLREHADSLKAASNLDIADFHCRFLVVQDLWIPLAEQLLISHFAPVWNRLIDGFGNHDPGSGRHGGLCPRWDVLHPGRAWAAKLKPRLETAEEILREVTLYLANTPIPSQAVLTVSLADK